MWRKKGSIHDPKHTSSSVKYSGGSVIAWACMDTSGVGSLIFIDYVTHDASKLIWRNFMMQQDNDQKHTANTTMDFIRKKKWKISPIEVSFHLQKRRLKDPPPTPETNKNRKRLQKKHQKRWMQQFGYVLDMLWICYLILNVIYFHLLNLNHLVEMLMCQIHVVFIFIP